MKEKIIEIINYISNFTNDDFDTIQDCIMKYGLEKTLEKYQIMRTF